MGFTRPPASFASQDDRVQDKCAFSDAKRPATPRHRCWWRRHSGEGSPVWHRWRNSQWQTFGDNFQPECLSRQEVQVSYVCGNPTANPIWPTTLTAHTLHDDRQRNRVGGHELEGREGGACAAAGHERGGEEFEWGSLMAWTSTRNGPLCDLKRAFSPSLNTGINVYSLWLRSTLDAASCCHPVRQELDSSGKGERTMQDSMPRWWLETHDTGQLFTNRMDGSETPKNASATLLCLLWNMPNESAQLAQKPQTAERERERVRQPGGCELLQGQCAESGTSNSKCRHRDPRSTLNERDTFQQDLVGNGDEQRSLRVQGRSPP